MWGDWNGSLILWLGPRSSHAGPSVNFIHFHFYSLEGLIRVSISLSESAQTQTWSSRFSKGKPPTEEMKPAGCFKWLPPPHPDRSKSGLVCQWWWRPKTDGLLEVRLRTKCRHCSLLKPGPPGEVSPETVLFSYYTPTPEPLGTVDSAYGALLQVAVFSMASVCLNWTGETVCLVALLLWKHHEFLQPRVLLLKSCLSSKVKNERSRLFL